jgi:hypothetical protein
LGKDEFGLGEKQRQKNAIVLVTFSPNQELPKHLLFLVLNLTITKNHLQTSDFVY